MIEKQVKYQWHELAIVSERNTDHNMTFIKKYFQVLKDAGGAFIEDNCVKLAASVSYYTIFAIGPLLLIIINLSGWFYGEEAVQGKINDELGGLLGPEAATYVQQVIQNVQQTDSSLLGTIIGAVILFIGATGVFTEIQDSINYIWSLKAKPKRGLVKLLINRLLSFSLIISIGFLLLVSLVVSALMALLNDRLTRLFPDTTVVLLFILNFALVFVVITLLFAIIFKVLPDGKIKWKDAMIGASFTAILFIIGKAGIGYYLGNSTLGVTYGAAASMIILLSWVYYTSIILYFGAEFTKIYALEFGGGITPNDTAVFIIKREAKEINLHPERGEQIVKEHEQERAKK
ncbi:YihY/virulence factor BrkB family protein [Aridibaculum aurantiacum]|uniref:YihY/virulence factor BrkB family protein n=1 Tax=Aridibaculum aurantiacum TaxID=2810307 RepID=UPI001F60C0B5|nr:YihY/virulence factor BrkB family protein [Aridibaculum aurantiacum]